MKLLKNPVFAVCLCVLVVVCSTFLSSSMKLNKRYQSTCNSLCYAMSDFASRNGLDDLSHWAIEGLDASSYRIKDMDGLIIEYNKVSSAYDKNEKKDVEKAIKSFRTMEECLYSFPASFFVDLLDLE